MSSYIQDGIFLAQLVVHLFVVQLRKAFAAVDAFIVDQETYKNHVTDVIAKWKMEQHCYVNGTFYEIASQLSRVNEEGEGFK